MATEEGQKLADELKCMFTETSAKVGINVKQLFKDVASILPQVRGAPTLPGVSSSGVDDVNARGGD